MAGNRLNLTNGGEPPEEPRKSRPFLGARFACCGVYARIYRNRQATAYEGHCPRCAKPIKIHIGPGGGSARFFEVS
ncbi:hypothetical protein SH139x_000850 [Planctomycetaceae bacterium SH139]